ncbi:hypothetical protein B0H17DRAFT_1218021 [Mycena rosella]|uniref:Uncharacterized protein n=1 Tax=Mycena rosella TaxID=1033263 RepID=A0AAD7FNH8_MYCRO|nr:hypothetical protein B0H17DRAFT_1218021 [Mycena rosella]
MHFHSVLVAIFAIAHATLIAASVPGPAASGIACGCYGDPITFCVPCTTSVTAPSASV